MTDISELTDKYVVIPRKYLQKPNFIIRTIDNSIRVKFRNGESLKHYYTNNSKYFVMKLQDEFNMREISDKLYERLMPNIYNQKIKGSDLSLLILNSISDKNKLL